MNRSHPRDCTVSTFLYCILQRTAPLAIFCALVAVGIALHAAESTPSPTLIPVVDLSGDAARQVVIAAGTEKVYQGHPTTLLLPDGKTMFCVWTYNHGGPCGPLKRSDDRGLTWSNLLDMPENWSTAKNCPALYRLIDPKGTARLFVFAGQGADGQMQQSHSLDDGKTWSPMKSVGLTCVMPFCSIAPIDGGKKLLGMTTIRRPGETKEARSNVITQSESTDGGFTWSPWRIVLDLGDTKPCEPELIRSPNGKQLLCLMRENSRKIGGLWMTSDDEGRTWSEVKPLPPGLHGDRHKSVYAADGRLVVCMRDTGRFNSTRNHFVAWVGRYEDITAGRDGQYRLKLLHSHAGSDCGYPGLERLPDGTLVATTYIKYRPGPEKHSVVSTRFNLAATDKLAATPAGDKPPQASAGGVEKIDVFTSGKEGYALYRIPGIVVTAKGTVLAYCEARRTGKSDWDTIDIMLRRSTDGGKTFAPRQKIADVPGEKTKNPVAMTKKLAGADDVTYNNPVAIADRSGAVHFLFCLEYMRCFYMRSDDDGQTFSKPVEITAAFDKFRPEYDWKVLATGPAHGIQLRSGRLVVPVWLSTGTGGGAHRPSVTSVIYSDDGGKTWQPGEIAAPNTAEWIFPNETAAVELADGRVMLNIRSESPGNRRLLTYSADGATGWTKPAFHEQLWEPICMASTARVSTKPAADKNRIVFANPHNLKRADSKETPGKSRDRKNLSIKLSYDEGQTWPVDKVLEPGFSGYSDLAMLPDGTILCFYERQSTDNQSSYKTGLLTVARFGVDWLTDGQDSYRPK